jgi:sugar lactone lactonase YvrE
MARSSLHGVRWHPPAPATPVPRRSDPRTLPALTLLQLPGYGPEHVTVDGKGYLLTGLTDGRIVRVGPAGDTEIVANTGGRPLGLELYGDDALVVCDAERGLLRVPLTGSASIDVLCNTVGGERLVFCSCPAVAADGTIYFSQSSQRFDFYHYKGDLLEHSSTGRVMRYRQGAVDIIADSLDFANGVVLSPDESTLAVAETGAYRVTRIQLTGAQAGQTSTLIAALPGFPDNLTTDADGLIWIGMASPRDATLDFLLPRAPWLRSAVWAIPDRLQPKPKNMAWALAIDVNGTIVHDLRAWNVGYHEVTAARVHDGKLYLASVDATALAVTDLPGATQRLAACGYLRRRSGRCASSARVSPPERAARWPGWRSPAAARARGTCRRPAAHPSPAIRAPGC